MVPFGAIYSLIILFEAILASLFLKRMTSNGSFFAVMVLPSN